MVWKLTDDDWDAVMTVHAGGTFRFIRAAVRQFRAQSYGRIINVTSYSGLHGNTGQANYATRQSRHRGPHQDDGQGTRRLRRHRQRHLPERRTPDGRRDPRGLGFLASEDAGYVTGAILPVDGGLAM